MESISNDKKRKNNTTSYSCKSDSFRKNNIIPAQKRNEYVSRPKALTELNYSNYKRDLHDYTIFYYDENNELQSYSDSSDSYFKIFIKYQLTHPNCTLNKICHKKHV